MLTSLQQNLFYCFINSAPNSALHTNKKSVKQKMLKFAKNFGKKLKSVEIFKNFELTFEKIAFPSRPRQKSIDLNRVHVKVNNS
ncbi:MAG: hypothetical protein A2017_07030 [Lentisphaerae bacterium GWF2_44_16]|nr:MAG: hypothetical protein A2017_07030 [Lentisphaerae bacterium GWF2_44_16]